MIAHTPGPWGLDERFSGFEIYGSSHHVAYLNRSFSTEPLRDDEIKSSRQGREERANAMLITAAPEMLASLRALLDLSLKQGYEAGRSVDADPDVIEARRAIAKAEGK